MPAPTKLGPHVLHTHSDLSRYLAARPAVAKFVGEWGLAANLSPDVFVVGRRHEHYDAQGQRRSGRTPQEAAQEFVSGQAELYQLNPRIVYWEGHNEPAWGSADEMAWYAQFEVARMQLMAEMDLRCVIGNFATGSPPLDLWPAFLPAVQAARQYRGVLGLHEYSCPYMWWMTGSHQLNPGEDEGDEGWTTLRYRKIYRQFLQPAGLGRTPLVITECGIDPMVNPKPAGAPASTWKTGLSDYWRGRDNELDAHDFYYRQLLWYDRELQKDSFVIGATVFTWGSFGPPWSDFDVAGTPVAGKLIDYTQANPGQRYDVDRQWGGVEPPAGRRGAPREQYTRTYVLLPPQAGAAWANAVVAATWDSRRLTVGSSADDAGIGDLDDRQVIAVNPDEWPGDLADFFAGFYPGVRYRAVSAGSPAELAQKLALL